jgi:hypothetical protein
MNITRLSVGITFHNSMILQKEEIEVFGSAKTFTVLQSKKNFHRSWFLLGKVGLYCKLRT